MQKRCCKIVCSTVLTPRCVVTLVLRFAVVNHISHFSANASVETLLRLIDEIELIFTCSNNDDVKAYILRLGLGVGVVLVVQSFMHSGCAVGCLYLALGEGGL